MNKKLYSMLLLVVLFLSILLVSANQVKVATITVPNQYSTIQDAVDHANAKDTIVLNSGVYNETVIVSKDLTINGQGRSNTVIEVLNASGPVEVNLNGVCVNQADAQNSVSIWLSGSRLVNANINSNAKVYLTNSDVWHPNVSGGGQILFFGNFLLIGKIVFSFYNLILFVILLLALIAVGAILLFRRYRVRNNRMLKKAKF